MMEVHIDESRSLTGAVAQPPRGNTEVRMLMDRAAKGEVACMPEVRAWLADGEKGKTMTEYLGSPPRWLLNELTTRASDGNLAVREAMERKLAEVRADLAGPDPTPMERLLAERAAFCWLIVYTYENSFVNSRDLTIRQAEFQQNKIDRAHRRFLSAVKTLATVRKLGLPAIQVNIARQQVNVAGG